MNQTVNLNIQAHQAIVFAAINQGLLTLWDIHDKVDGPPPRDCSIAADHGTGCDAWMGGLALLAGIATPSVDAVADRLYKLDLLDGVFTYEHVEVSRRGSMEGDTISHALWHEFVNAPGEDFYQLCNNWRADPEKVAQIVYRWGKELEAKKRAGATVS